MTFLRSAPDGGKPGSGIESPQYAALCYRTSRRAIEVLLITSRDTGRWVIPKGWPMAGLPPEEAAAREAFEEAGVKGKITGDALGTYGYLKRLPDDETLPCRVQVFPLRVSRMSNDFPEKGQRRLKWFKPAAAAKKVQEAELQAILSGFKPPD